MGRYEKVQGIIDRERTFGRLKGVSDLEAYINIATQMEQQERENAQAQTEEKPKPSKKADPKVDAKKKAAGSVRRKTTAKKKFTDNEFLNMSDEEFAKIEANGLY